MAGNDVQIQLTAKDGASSVFKTVGRSAQDMGKQVETAGKNSEQSLSRMSKAGAVAGAAFASLSGVLSIASHANAEAEASQARLTTAIENSGHSVDEYQDQLDAASKKALQLGFDDEDAADSIAALTSVTGDANKAISDLSIAEDVARARNISLEAATKLVIAAEQGRVGALARAGVAVDASMSKEQVLDALRAKYAGNADAYSTTTAAGFDRLKNSTENALEAIGAHLGPVNGLLMALPTLSAGFTAAGAAVGALVPEMTAATAAAGLLDLALGPVGLAALAIGAGIAIFELSRHMGNDLAPGAEAANTALEKTNQLLRDQLQIGSVLAPLTHETADTFGYIDGAAKDYDSTLKQLTGDVAEHATQLDAMNQDVLVGADAKAREAEALHTAELALANYMATAGAGQITTAKAAAANDAANAILEDTGLAAADAQLTLKTLEDQVNSGAIGWRQFADDVIALAAGLPAADEAAITARDSIQKTTDAINGGSEAGKEAINVFTGYKQSIQVLGDHYTTLDGQIQTTNALMASGSTYGDAHSASIKRLGDQYTNLDGSLAGNSDLQAQANEEADKATQLAKAQAAAYTEAAAAIDYLDTGLDKLIASGDSTWAERTASRVSNATDALSSLYSVVVGGTKTLSSQSQEVNDWAMGLINVKGVTGEIDTLLANHQITQTTYNKAQEAGTAIFADNAAIQEDLLRIQTKQAPLIAAATDAEAKYIDQLADLPPQQELVALGWMDTNEAAKANAALALAAAAANDQYGDSGEEAATKAITAQARADPAFAAMLQDMGLISVGADGEITVNFPNATSVHDDTVNLTASIDALTKALGGVPPNTTANVDVTGTDAANAAIQSVRDQLAALNGSYANATISVGLVGPGVGYQLPRQHGGVIPHAQHGSSMHGSPWYWVGEAGAELSNGQMVIPHTASVETSRGKGGGGDIHVHGGITVVANDPRQFSDQMRSYNFGYGART